MVFNDTDDDDDNQEIMAIVTINNICFGYMKERRRSW